MTKFGLSRDPSFVASFQLEFTSMLSRTPPPRVRWLIPRSRSLVSTHATIKISHRATGLVAREVMRNSYVVMDERLRLLDCSNGGKLPSSMSVIEDVHAALAHIGFDDVAFRERDGEFFIA